MKKQGFYLILCVIFTAVMPIVSFGQKIEARHTSFDEGWKFHLGHAANPEKDFNYSTVNIFAKTGGAWGAIATDAKFKDSTWQTINLPHDWAVDLQFVNVKNADVESHGFKPVGGLFPETSIGWYRKHFTIVRADSGARFQIQFDGIYRDANVWMNGVYLGNNKSGYIGMVYDITDFINYGGDNVLVVRADATQFEGWFYEGAGIYRHTWLNKYQNVHIATDGIFAHADIQNNKATLTVETTLANEDAVSDATVTASLLDKDGKILAKSNEQPFNLNLLEEKTLKQIVTINNPHLWSLDDPYLHRVLVEVKSKGVLIDKQILRFGFRTVEIKTNGIFLNGKHTKIHGVNCHQDHAGVGSAIPDYLQYYRMNLLKNMGVNAYRTSHNPPTPELLDACDSLGILVLDEQRQLNSGAEYMSQFERMVKRDRSRACVFMWSIGNEEGWIHTKSIGKRIAQTYINKLKILDPTRTCTYAADVPNVYAGVNEVIPVRSFNYRQFAVADYHKDHPNQPLMGTEMGSTVTTRGIYEKDTVRGYLQDEDVFAPWWASTAEEWWKLAAPNDYWLGGFVWTGFDYRGEPTPYSWPNINSHFGIMDMCGFPKNIYYYYQSWWTDKDVLHISPHWNWRDKRGQPIDVWVNSNADSVELFLNGKTLSMKTMPRNSHLQWSVKFEAGKLEAVGYKKGKKLNAKVETTGLPTEVVLTPYKTTMLADGKDLTVMNVSVVDREGREVPDADNLIKFSIHGDGKIIGVGNGDPSSHEPDKCVEDVWQRSLFNGKCQVIVQSGKQSGIIKFEAKATGLWAGSTDIFTVGNEQLAMSHELPNMTQSSKLKAQSSTMLGADISFLPELEASGIKFSERGVEKDAIKTLKEHGFNYVRLRIFNDPARDSGYSPKRGFCDLANTKRMAKRVKEAGMKLLLDFHYSDYWADPGKQFKPAAWRDLSFPEMKRALYDYTKNVVQELKAQGTTPDMIQIGNEINHGIVWPEGSVANLDSLAQLLNAGEAAVKSVDANIAIMLHVALGGQNHESVFFIDNMLARGVNFDVIGESYYPKWHGTLDDLHHNLNDLVRRYKKDVIVVEYSQLKEEVNKISFELPDGHGKGTCIWEPLSTWESIFDKEGKSNDLLYLYDKIAKQYLSK